MLPGWKLGIPATMATPTIERTVSEIPGDRLALVIDDTGSMNDDREKVAEYYLAAMRKYGKQIVGVFLYADGQVRKYEANGSVSFRTSGDRENTHGAIKEAAKENPDAIILLTDERGDDWNVAELDELPKVYAHCLPNSGNYECRQSLERVATATKGQYIEGLK